ncbi:MAG: histidinol-phosphate transaminase [Planctomycetota bacterium]
MGLPRPRPEVEALSPYVPGEQPSVGQRVVKLNTNEASFPVPSSVLAAASVDADLLRRYPDPRASRLREMLAERHGVTPEHVLIGNGSDDILTMLIRTFVPPGGSAAFPWPTYSLYPTLLQIQGASATKVDWLDDWQLPADALVDAGADAVFLANPNAPSGTLIAPAEVSELATRLGDTLLLVDEAYADYASTDCMSLVASHANVVVSRSFSKGFALAGLRLGYAISRPETIRQMDKVRDSYNVDALAQAVGEAAVAASDEFAKLRSEVCERRSQLSADLSSLGFDVTPSEANFVFARHPKAGELYQSLHDRGIFVRYWNQPGLDDALRITIGTSDEHDVLLRAIRECLESS